LLSPQEDATLLFEIFSKYIRAACEPEHFGPKTAKDSEDATKQQYDTHQERARVKHAKANVEKKASERGKKKGSTQE